jgi:hypothetical protein
MAAEQLRRLLLKEMGITSWFPRAPLPGAALSHEQCLHNFLDESIVGQQHAAAAADDIQAHTPSVAQLAQLLAKKTVEPIPPVVKPVMTPVAVQTPAAASHGMPGVSGTLANKQVATTAPDQDVDAFGFSWFNIDRRLAVLAMLPAGNSRLTTSCRQMLARLLAALHTPWQSLTLVDQNFHWPFVDDLGLPADASAAGQAVDGFIARRLGEQKCAMVLVLSADLPWFLHQSVPAQEPSLVSEHAAVEVAKLSVHRQFGFATLTTHSLHDMENDAGLKREAWQSMQLLRERLNK